MSIHRVSGAAQIILVLGLVLLGACSESDNPGSPEAADSVSQMHVFKNPSCSCCSEWIKHVEAEGFHVAVGDSERLASIKEEYGISPQFQSCHTAIYHGYVFEGHIPVSLIKQFLRERPPGALGLAVPGMPAGSPGMEMAGRQDPYDVLLLKDDGTATVYAHVDGVKSR